MSEDYTTEKLEETFMKHHVDSSRIRNDLIEKYKKDYPNEPLPASFLDDFSISKALHVICREINQIKKGNS